MAGIQLPPQSELRQLYEYCDTGRLIFKPRGIPWFDAKYAGTTAGALTKNGYLLVPINGRKAGAHRVIFAMFNDLGVEDEIDHINGNRVDNRLENLRRATRSQNVRGTRKNFGASTYKGVSKSSRTKGKWCARIRVDRLDIHLGTFICEKDAARAYDVAATCHHKEFAITNADLGLL